MTKLILYFESEKIRRHFLEDISELILLSDAEIQADKEGTAPVNGIFHPK